MGALVEREYVIGFKNYLDIIFWLGFLENTTRCIVEFNDLKGDMI